MKINSDLHTHTLYSHGKSTIEENVLSALSLGLKKIAITEHGLGHITYGVKKEDWVKMRQEVDQLKIKYPQIKILLGVEANITGMKGTLDVTPDQEKNLDIINCGYHYGVRVDSIHDFFSFYLLNLLAKLIPAFKNKAREVNTRALLLAMDRYKINMITHPGAKVPIDIDKIARKAAEKKVLLEINAHHKHLNEEDLLKAMKYEVRFSINSDAHHASHIGRLEEGIKIAEEAGLSYERIENGEDD
ncbi:MAG: PHP domain-containing protein [Eubacteriaceae bacterium]|nr:PHP domain-containing protein [Eubacteriaceae bacterium]